MPLRNPVSSLALLLPWTYRGRSLPIVPQSALVLLYSSRVMIPSLLLPTFCFFPLKNMFPKPHTGSVPTSSIERLILSSPVHVMMFSVLPHLNRIDTIRKLSFQSGTHTFLNVLVDKAVSQGFQDCVNNVNPRAKHDVSLETLFNVNLSEACTDNVLSPLIM